MRILGRKTKKLMCMRSNPSPAIASKNMKLIVALKIMFDIAASSK